MARRVERMEFSFGNTLNERRRSNCRRVIGLLLIMPLIPWL
jgi:hypothetical protein